MSGVWETLGKGADSDNNFLPKLILQGAGSHDHGPTKNVADAKSLEQPAGAKGRLELI